MKLEKDKMCKIIKKDLHREHWEDYVQLVAHPSYVCKKCGLVSSEDNMCSPSKLPKDHDASKKKHVKEKEKNKEKDKRDD